MLPLSKERVFVLTDGGKAGTLIRSAKKRGFVKSRPVQVGLKNGCRHVTVYLTRDKERSAA